MKVGQKWEWIKGDKIGITETIISIDDRFVNFTNSRCSIDLLNEYMTLLIDFYEDENLNAPVNFDDSIANQNPLLGYGVTYKVANTTTSIEPVIVQNNDFYQDILSKAKCDGKLKINIEFDIDFISVDKVKMLIEMYGDELKDSLDLFIRNKIKEEVIMKSISNYTDSYK